MLSRILLAAQKLLIFKEIRHPVGLLRYYFYRCVGRGIKVYSESKAEHLGRNTFEHNFQGMRRSITKHERVLHLIWPLLAIERVARDRSTMKTLSIGPRSEGELLLLAGYGFKWKNIHGIDLFSYCPRIDVGDMHEMPYADSTFDVVFSGWSLGYSDEQERALKEIVRVLKPGGYVAFGQGYNADTGTKTYWAGAKDRSRNTIDTIFAPIKEHVDTVYFRHELTPEMIDRGERAILTVFSIRK